MAEPGTFSVIATAQDFDNNGVGARIDQNGTLTIKELSRGTGSFEVAFRVQAVRKGFKDRPVVIDRKKVEYR
jgi:hypothetical protein